MEQQEDRNVRLQNLRDFTVQIRHADDEERIVGTGVAVSMDGQIVTCAHVVRDAGVDPRAGDGAEVGVYFPQARGGETKARKATVAAHFPQHDDDVVLLRLTEGAAPLAPEQIATLGTAKPSTGNGFRSYGYAPVGDRLARYAYGTVAGAVEVRPAGGNPLHEEPVELRTRDIRDGMSGGGVLDVERNLVVGLITSYWRNESDPDNIGYATDGRVLTFAPLSLPVQEEPLAKGAAPQPKTDVDAARRQAAPEPGVVWNNAPPPLAEWTGRERLLQALTRDWRDPQRQVTGLIGFGGEGKSSLARKWVDDLLDNPASSPDGVFWWGFYDNPGVDEFFEAALAFMSGGTIDPRRLPAANVKAQVIAAMLGSGRILFVLDGLEVMQHQEGDRYGLLRSNDLRDFLELFAAPGHESFCLVTSRAPLLDLMAYTTYTHRDVERLSAADGRALLRALGVTGPDDALDEVVQAWDGHALTVSLVGSYLTWRHDGDVAHADEFDPVGDEEPALDDGAPDAARQRYKHVHRVLRHYDAHLTEAEQAFLTLFSAFRTPVRPEAFNRVFRAHPTNQQTNHPTDQPSNQQTTHLTHPLAALTDAEFDALVKRLLEYRLLRHNEAAGHYTAHPLVRHHYLARLTQRPDAPDAHTRIKEYYLATAGDTPHHPTLDDLAPLIEVVYHACRAGAYDEGYVVHRDRILQRNRFVLMHELGAFETELTLMKQFFPDGDTSQEPQVSEPRDKSWILNMVGGCLMSLGRLAEAAPFYERGNAMDAELEDWRNASIGYNNLAALRVHLGELPAGATAAEEALTLAHRAENKQDEMASLAYQGWALHLQGQVKAADEAFRQAEALEQEIDSSVQYLYSLRGIQHAEHLRQVGAVEKARRVTEANLEICKRNRWRDNWGRSHRVLGNLDAGAGQHAAAHAHYDEALKIARSITRQDVLIEALLARGHWLARLHAAPDPKGFGNPSGLPLDQAFSDLQEALDDAVDGGYRLYEADVRVALAWAHHAAGAPGRAQAEAQRALRLSQEMGYHWGQVDAREVPVTLNEVTGT